MQTGIEITFEHADVASWIDSAIRLEVRAPLEMGLLGAYAVYLFLLITFCYAECYPDTYGACRLFKD